MNKYFFMLLVVFTFSLYSFADAASVARQMPEDGKFNFGFELTWLTERILEDEELARVASNQYLITGSYGLLDALAVFGKLGAANLELHRQEGETTLFSEGPAVGLGARGVIFKDPFYGYWINAEAQYFAFFPASGGETTGARKDAFSSGGKPEVTWQEWHFALDYTQDFEDYNLYGGIKFSSAVCREKRKFSGYSEKSSFESRDNFGFFGGIDFIFWENLKANFEVKFLDETAYTFRVFYCL